ncbi:YhjD/YihY/BrkB family envelope integrity protein, partial [Streptomyces sp. NPDC054813]
MQPVTRLAGRHLADRAGGRRARTVQDEYQGDGDRGHVRPPQCVPGGLGPGTQRQHRAQKPGQAASEVLLLGVSLGFAVRTSHVSTYHRLYGSLAGVVVFLVWLWLSNLSLLAALSSTQSWRSPCTGDEPVVQYLRRDRSRPSLRPVRSVRHARADTARTVSRPLGCPVAVSARRPRGRSRPPASRGAPRLGVGTVLGAPYLSSARTRSRRVWRRTAPPQPRGPARSAGPRKSEALHPTSPPLRRTRGGPGGPPPAPPPPRRWGGRGARAGGGQGGPRGGPPTR